MIWGGNNQQQMNPMKKIELVIFDMAGTTVRDDDTVNICLREALAAGQVTVTRDEVNLVMGFPKPIAIQLILERKLGQATDAAIQSIHEDFLWRMIHFYRTDERIEPMPHTVATMIKLKDAGVKVALDTGFSRPIVNAILARLGWDDVDLLDATVASDEVAQGRPHPDMVFRAMELTGVKDVAAVAKVGDTPSDLLEGTAAGCGLVIGVLNGTHTREQLAGHPHTHLIGSLAELPAVVLGNGKG